MEKTLATPELEANEENIETPTLNVPKDEETSSVTVEKTEEEPTVKTEENIDTGSDEESTTDDEYSKVWDDEVNEEDIFNPSKDEPPSEKEVETEPTSEVQEPITNGVVITKPLKYKGSEIAVKSEDEAIALMQKGLDYEFKMTRIKPFRQAIDIIDKAGLEPGEIQALADLKSGKAEALDYIKNKFGIEDSKDDEDIFFEEDKPKEEKSPYNPEPQQVDPVKEIWDNVIQNDKSLANKALETWNQIEPSFQQELYNENVFPAFLSSVQSGEFEKLYPEVIKVKALNPSIKWLDAYVGVAQQVLKTEPTNEQPTKTVQREVPSAVKRETSPKDDYDSAWEAASLDELEQQLFKG